MRAIDIVKRLIKSVYGLRWDLASLLTPFWQKRGFDVTFMYLVIGGAFTRSLFSVICIELVIGISGFRTTRIKRHWHNITLLLASLVLLQYHILRHKVVKKTTPQRNAGSSGCILMLGISLSSASGTLLLRS